MDMRLDAERTRYRSLNGLAQIERAIVKDGTMSVEELSKYESETLTKHRERYWSMGSEEFEIAVGRK